MTDPWPTVLANLGLARWHANRWSRSPDDFDELYGEAVIALHRAAVRYDPTRGTIAQYMRFTAPRALGLVRRGLDAPVHQPHGVSVRRADPVVRDDGEVVPAVDLLVDEDPIADELADQRERVAVVLRAVERLPAAQRALVRARWLTDDGEVPIEAAGRRMGLRREAARQLEKRALRALRETIESRPARQES